MSTTAVGAARGAPGLQAALIALGLVALCAAVVTETAVVPVAGVLAVLATLVAGHRSVLRWEALVVFVVLVVLVIPIKRYQFAVSLPFDLEPYRVVTALLIALWIAALLVDPRVRLRGSALDGPLLLFGLAAIASVALNPGRIISFNIVRSFAGSAADSLPLDFKRLPVADLSTNVTKELLFLASFYLAFYFIVSVVRSPAAVHTVLKALVLGGGVVALFALIEARTGYNVFNQLQGWIPAIQFQGGLEDAGIQRGGRLRVYASAQHPIALAALFAMLLPLALYLAHQTRRRGWLVVSAMLLLGALGAVSRTGVVMIGVIIVVFLVLRPKLVRRLPILILPALIVIHFALPNTIGSLYSAFFPAEGLVAEQTEFGGRVSPRRLSPQFEVIREQPAFGQGIGTRVTSGPDRNARILDNQWLGVAVETGLVGMFAWVWLFVRFARRAGRAARRDPSGRGFLLTALAGSIVAFAFGMFTYDAFSFIQVTFVLFVLLALGCSVLAWEGEWPERGAATGRGLSGGGLPAERLPGTPREPPERLLTT